MPAWLRLGSGLSDGENPLALGLGGGSDGVEGAGGRVRWSAYEKACDNEIPPSTDLDQRKGGRVTDLPQLDHAGVRARAVEIDLSAYQGK